VSVRPHTYALLPGIQRDYQPDPKGRLWPHKGACTARVWVCRIETSSSGGLRSRCPLYRLLPVSHLTFCGLPRVSLGFIGDVLTYDLGHQGMNVVHDSCPGSSMGMVKVTFDGTVDYHQFREIRRVSEPDAPFAPDVQFLQDQHLRLFWACTQGVSAEINTRRI